MINGYVTYDELKLITGYDEKLLNSLIISGITAHQLSVQTTRKREITLQLYNLDEVTKWISAHIF